MADPTEAWTRAGFSVGSDSVCRIGGVGIRLVGRDRGAGIVGWSLRRLPSDVSVNDVDGVPTARSGQVSAASSAHPNGVIAIDHVVLLSPDLGRTVKSLAAVGVDPRRERDSELGGRPIHQIFFRLEEVIVEVDQFAGYGRGGSVFSVGDDLRRNGHRRNCLVLRRLHGTGQGRGATWTPDQYAAASGVRHVGPDGVDFGARPQRLRRSKRIAHQRSAVRNRPRPFNAASVMGLRKIEPVLAVGLRWRARRWLIDLAGGGRSRDAIKSRESSYVLAVVREILRPNHAVT